MTIEPRPWITLEDLTSEDETTLLCPLPEKVTEVAALAGIDVATAVLYERTGRRWSGIETVNVRPKAQDTASLATVPGWVQSWGSYDSGDGPCTGSASIELGYFPVDSVLQVRIDGVVLSASAYELRDERTLVRVDGGVWPCNQNLSLPATDLGTFEVRVVHGIEPPEAGKIACAVYAVELAKSFCNLECQLPARTQYATRQGVSTILSDPLNVIDRGMIGLPIVDSWIRSVNPHGRRKRAMMISGKDVEPDCKYPLARANLGVDYYGYPNRGINRFCG